MQSGIEQMPDMCTVPPEIGIMMLTRVLHQRRESMIGGGFRGKDPTMELTVLQYRPRAEICTATVPFGRADRF